MGLPGTGKEAGADGGPAESRTPDAGTTRGGRWRRLILWLAALRALAVIAWLLLSIHPAWPAEGSPPTLPIA